MKLNLKLLTSAFITAFFLIVAFGSYDDDKSSSKSTSSNDKKTIKKIGETLPTKYFEVKVNSMKVKTTVDTGNEYADLKAEPGNQYLIMNVTFKNTDNESRMITDGEIIINTKGKDYTFEEVESVMLDGWGLFLDQINPLTSKTTNLVYKIPSDVKGTAYYKPGRSDNDDMIELGSIK